MKKSGSQSSKGFTRVIFTTIFLLTLLLSVGMASADYQNAFMIIFDGAACDNVAYAKSMGYDYVGYRTGMEDCLEAENIRFYLESPDQKVPVSEGYIYLSKYYTTTQKNLYNDMLLWKSSASFPYNIATGWFRADNSFKPLMDFQQQSVINYQIDKSMNWIDSVENTQRNFRFGGWMWDVPSLEGDLWSGQQNLPLQGLSGTGRQVDISYWTGTCSGIKHPGLPQDYTCYRDGRVAFYKQLISETKKSYPDVKTVMEPYYPWAGYMEEIASRYDAAQLAPDLLCQEGNTLDFVTDSRLFSSNLMEKDEVCSSSTKDYYHDDNLVLAGNAGINGAWFLWYGRLGGTGDFPRHSSIRDIPDRLKLIRSMPGWDNMNNVPLSARSWSSSRMEYESTLSLANRDLIKSVHPVNKKTYVVVLDRSTGIDLGGKAVESIYRVDELFRASYEASNHFYQSNGRLYLSSDSNEGRGYIITLSGDQYIPPPEPEPQPGDAPYCTDTDGEDFMTKGAITGLYSDGKAYTLTDICTDANTLYEYYCLADDYHQRAILSCDFGCSDGACLPETSEEPEPQPGDYPVCADSDAGNDPDTYGAITGIYSDGKAYTLGDYCSTANAVTEYYCFENTYHQRTTQTCQYGCENGECQPETQEEPEPQAEYPICADSDNGQDLYTSGAITGIYADGNDYILSDYCSSASSVTEYYCFDNTYHQRATQTCQYGCENGACLTESAASPEYPVCADSDAGNDLYNAGAITGIYADEKAYTLTDVCTDANTVIEYYCLRDTYHQRTTQTCAYGCDNGACKLLPSFNPTDAPICADSDDGNNPESKGYITGLYADGKEYTLTDTCTTSNTVREYYCLDGEYHQLSTQSCANGCANGQCI